MNLHINGDINVWFLPYGLRVKRSSVGDSVARASDARVSIIRLTHSIWMALNGESLKQNIIIKFIQHSSLFFVTTR